MYRLLNSDCDNFLNLVRLITNLDFKVTDEDVQELFENCGAIKKAGILYDRRYSLTCFVIWLL